MKNKYQEYIQSQNRFNKWEMKYIANLPVDKKLDQFVELFELEPPKKILEKNHQEHLNSIVIQSNGDVVE